MQSIFITGGCGFVGSNLAVAFAGRGASVTVLDNLSRRGSDLIGERLQSYGVRFVHGDIRDPQAFASVGDRFDLMIECSAEPSVLAGTTGAQADFVVQNNLVGALHCFEWARARSIPVLFLSTSRVYPHTALAELPLTEAEARWAMTATGPGYGPEGITPDFPMAGARSLYGATKWAAEIVLQEYALQYNLPALINRCGVIAGPWQLGKVDQGVFTYWLVRHMTRQPLQYIGFGGTGKQVRDLLHIDDLTDLVMMQFERIQEFRGEIFHAAGSATANLSLQETTTLCEELTGVHVAVEPVAQARPADVRWLMLDHQRTTATFGWRPRRAADHILKDIHAWLVQHPAYVQVLAGA